MKHFGGNSNFCAGYWHTYPEKAAAGMYSTASDIARFLIHIAQAYNGALNTILEQNTVRKMLTVQLPGGRFGLGATLYGDKFQENIWFGHEGINLATQLVNISAPYPEIGDSSFRCALWTFKQQLTLKMRARCSISIVLL